MVVITEELIRKRAEHNEGIIGTLEELTLHQEDIEKIENLNNWCRELQILYLQANQISKLENLNKLKKLQYLNLAINNIEKIENLERCESLEKLDLTLNFIGDLESIKNLSTNVHLKDLYLTGNPCADFKYYREYVVAHLPQLESLDIQPITKSDKIKAIQNLERVEESIKKDIAKYKFLYYIGQRDEAKEKAKQFREQQKQRRALKPNSNLSDDEFWKSVSENSPETRLEIAKRQQTAKKDRNEDRKNNKRAVTNVKLFTKDGRPLNINQAKLNFTFSDESPEKFTLEVKIYKFLDTNLIQIDLQPIYVTLTIKGKIFQIVFSEEIHVEKSTAQRSQTTGHLVLTLPKLNYTPLIYKQESKNGSRQNENLKGERNRIPEKPEKKTIEFLDVTAKKNDEMDFGKIVENSKKANQHSFEDNPEVPMLEYG